MSELEFFFFESYLIRLLNREIEKLLLSVSAPEISFGVESLGYF